MQARFNPVQLLTVCSLIVIFTGCGGDPPASEESSGQSTEQSETQGTAAAQQPSDGNTSNSASTPRGQNEVWVDEDGNKFIGKVPYDVFFDSPYDVAANSTPLAGNAVAGGPGGGNLPEMGTGAVESSNDTTVTDSGSSESTGSSDDWTELMSLSVLESEVKDIRNFLTPTLQSVGNYNSSMLMIPPRAATLAVLSEIAINHPEAVSWQEDAVYIRDLAKKMNESTLQRGAKDQRRLLELFENMTDTFNRSRPAGLEEPPAEDSFADVAEMRLVMMRMADAERKMKTEAGSESAFGSQKEMIQHEAALLRTLTRVISLEGYGYGDDPDFTAYADKIIEASDQILAATETGDFSSYDLALSSISTTCQSCHSDYKND